MERRALTREEITAGVLAGIAGGIVIEVFFFLRLLPGGQAVKTLLGSFAFTSTVLLGPSASGNPAVVALGIAVHLGVSIAWALGYVYLARRQRQLIEHPWISGAAFGLIVYIFTQLVLLTVGALHGPGSGAEFIAQVVAHVVFYGIPVGLVASRVLRSSRTTASGRAV